VSKSVDELVAERVEKVCRGWHEHWDADVASGSLTAWCGGERYRARAALEAVGVPALVEALAEVYDVTVNEPDAAEAATKASHIAQTVLAGGVVSGRAEPDFGAFIDALSLELTVPQWEQLERDFPRAWRAAIGAVVDDEACVEAAELEAEASKLRNGFNKIQSRNDRYAALIDNFAAHDSWRCDHPDRYPQDDDCPCGLLGDLAKAGIDPEPWRRVHEQGDNNPPGETPTTGEATDGA